MCLFLFFTIKNNHVDPSHATPSRPWSGMPFQAHSRSADSPTNCCESRDLHCLVRCTHSCHRCGTNGQCQCSFIFDDLSMHCFSFYPAATACMQQCGPYSVCQVVSAYLYASAVFSCTCQLNYATTSTPSASNPCRGTFRRISSCTRTNLYFTQHNAQHRLNVVRAPHVCKALACAMRVDLLPTLRQTEQRVNPLV